MNVKRTNVFLETLIMNQSPLASDFPTNAFVASMSLTPSIASSKTPL